MAYNSSRGVEWRALVAILAITDVACVLASFLIAFWVTTGPVFHCHGFINDYGSLVVAVTPTLLLVFAGHGLYDRTHLLWGTREYASVLRACSYGVVTVIVLSFVLRKALSREWTLLSLTLMVMLLGFTRFMLRRLAVRMRRRGRFIHRTLVVGGGSHGIDLARRLSEPRSGVSVVGLLDGNLAAGTRVGEHTVLGKPASMVQVAERTQADEVVIVSQGLPWETFQELLTNAVYSSNGIPIHVSAGFYDLLTFGVNVSERNRIPLMTLRKVTLSASETLVKRVLDYSVATALLLFSIPVFAWAALRVGSLKPRKLFASRRVRGRFGEQFELLSFPRELAVSSSLVRKLPGLLNVLRGQLSIVGPQPAPVNGQSAVVQTELTIRPGLTGPWRQTDDPGRQVLLDLYYVRSYSIWLDLQVLLKRVMCRVRRSSIASARATEGL